MSFHFTSDIFEIEEFEFLESSSPRALLPFFNSSGVSPATVSKTDNALDTSDATTYTFTSKAIGAAATGRLVVVALQTLNTSAISLSSCTIGGISATIIGTATANNGSVFISTALAYAVVPTGTTATVAATWSTSTFRCYLGVWSAYGVSSSTPTTSATSAANPSVMSSINVSAGGIAIGASNIFDVGGTGTFTWTNLTKDYDADGEGSNEQYSGASAAFASAQTGISITATPSAADRCCGIAASWR